eukprot:2762803-Amphidinium_carterae.1
MSRARRWAEPRNQELLKRWGRDEVTVGGGAAAPKQVPEGFFQPVDSAKKDEWALLHHIKDTQTWPTFTTSTVSSIGVELAVAAHLHVGGVWASIAEMWKCLLLPEKEVVHNVVTDKYCLVLSTSNGIAALLWDLVLEGDVFEMIPMAGMAWEVVTCLDSWEVVPTV